MKILLAVVGLVIVIICLVVESGDTGPPQVNLGYFLVAFGCILGSALWRDSPEPIGVNQRAYDIYRHLAKESLSAEDLLDKLTNGTPGYEIGDAYKAVVGKLVNDGMLVFRDGRLEIAVRMPDQAT